MPTEGQHSLTDSMITFATRLRGLRADQNPDDLSNVLRAAIKERELYNMYVSSLIEDTERTEALLEVFDKVCSVICAILWEFVLSVAVGNRLLRLPHTISRSLNSFCNSPVEWGFCQPPTSFQRSSSKCLSVLSHVGVPAMFGRASVIINEWR